jgi:pyruvate dehydrogenase E2 component (dihydrolipoamide acetyltransferase)
VTQIAQEIPKVGLVMEEVKVVRWLKNVGDNVLAGEPLLEVETEKSVVEIEAAATGRLTQILVQANSPAVVGDQVAWIESAHAAAAPRSSQAASAVRSGARVRSTPIARKLAAEQGIGLDEIAGTGPGGRVQLQDVQRAIAAPRATGVGSQPLSPMRRAVARAMTTSRATVPQFTVARAVDWTLLQSWRGEFSARLPDAAPKLSVNDFLMQAIARALIEFPALNATFSGDPETVDAHLIQASGAHIGLVVAVDDGLLVPVIHDIERLGLFEIARRRQDCIKRALLGRLKREDLDGATISISNLGVNGPDTFTAIINPPQSAILAVGRPRDCVVPRDGDIVVRPLSDLTLTVDHRVADGRLAAQFIARLVAILEGRDWRLQ